jgi:hypothetical protein
MAHWCLSNPSPSLVPGWAFRIVIDVNVQSAISFDGQHGRSSQTRPHLSTIW